MAIAHCIDPKIAYGCAICLLWERRNVITTRFNSVKSAVQHDVN